MASRPFGRCWALRAWGVLTESRDGYARQTGPPTVPAPPVTTIITMLGAARARGQVGHVAVAGWPVHGTVRWTGARGRGAAVHGGPRLRERASRLHGPGPREPACGGGKPRSTVDRAPERERAQAGRRWRHGRRAGARRGGGPRRERARQGHQRVRLGEANAMGVSPSRNVDGKEKLDGGGADFDEFGGGAVEFGESG
ncbi:hypothetical protein BDA96_10G155900 [Sorghum bicolor]|uniref:Uncharacterized protein n=1 Tax=Sorghum bicolor TaxID=4558 RepID=A0A921U116_SORBI|nr:hypothetical protein BDA96_10G155900 [Sorghum bicolor]